MINPGMRKKVFALTQLTLTVMDGCGATCRHCWLVPAAEQQATGALPPAEIKTMALETALRAVREAMPLGLMTVRLCGGCDGPLMHPDYDALVNELERLGVQLDIETTGRGITPERAEQLARIPGARVAIQLLGADAATHDGLRQRPGAFEKTMQAARLLASSGVTMQIVFAVVKQNIDQINAALQIAHDLKAKELRLVTAHPRLNQDGCPQSCSTDSIVPVEKLIAVGRKIERDLAPTARLRLVFEQPPAFRGLHPTAPVERQPDCNILSNLDVLPDGSYALCGLAAPALPSSEKLILGRAGVDSLSTLWSNHSTLALLREGMPERLHGICQRCAMNSACLGSCAAENYLRTGAFWGPYWFCESADRVGLFPASRLIENRW